MHQQKYTCFSECICVVLIHTGEYHTQYLRSCFIHLASYLRASFMPTQKDLTLLKLYVMGIAVNSSYMHLLPGVQVDLPDVFLEVELLDQRYMTFLFWQILTNCPLKRVSQFIFSASLLSYQCCTFSNFLICAKYMSKQMCPEWFSRFQSCFLQFTTHSAAVVFHKRESDSVPQLYKTLPWLLISWG